MKYLIAVQFTLIVCFSTKILAKPKFKSTAAEVIKTTYKVNSLQLITKCISKGKFGIIQLAWNRVVDDKLPNTLANEMLKIAKQSKSVDENGWKKISNDVCLSKSNLMSENKKDVDTINQCFPKEKQLEGAKKDNFANALLESFCSAVRSLATEMLAEEKKGGKANP